MGIGINKYLERLGVEVHEAEGTCEAAIWMCPPNHVRRWLSNQRPMIVSMWEASRLPAGMRENLHEFEAVFVPSRQNEELFGRYHDNVIYMPLGIDPEIWNFKARKPIDKVFNFYAPGQAKRKGVDVVVEAFRKAFPRTLDPNPHLILKSFTRDDQFPDDARFEHVNGVISSGDEMALYEHAHCTMGLARGEGFGLMPIQAIAQGCPTILSNAHGHAEYAHLALPVPCTTTSAMKFLYGDAGDWWEPDVDTTVDYMRAVYADYPVYEKEAESNARLCHEQFSWGRAASIIKDTVGESSVLTEQGDLHLSQAKLYKMTTTRYSDPFIAGISYRFERDHEYLVPADVRRVMKDAGYVTDDTPWDEDEDQGVLPTAEMALGLV